MPATSLKLSSHAVDNPQLELCAKQICNGGLVILPMETVYGAMVRLDHPQALSRLRSLRGPAERRAMTLHVDAPASAMQYVDTPDRYAMRLMQKLWPGPVAMMFRVSPAHRDQIVDRLGIHAEDLFDGEVVTIRCPAHPATREVIRRCPHPLVAGVPADDASRVETFAPEVVDKVDLIVDDGPCPYGRPSTILRVEPGRFDIVRAGVYDRRIIEKMLQTTILFVCSGNTCRSPMAEAVARKVLSDHLQMPINQLERAGYTILSAGTVAMAGMPATQYAEEAVRELGSDLSRHRSRPLTEQLIQQADVIFTMGNAHTQAVKSLVPAAADKVTRLDPDRDIEDPIGGDLSQYQSLAKKLQQCIEARLHNQTLPGWEKR